MSLVGLEVVLAHCVVVITVLGVVGADGQTTVNRGDQVRAEVGVERGHAWVAVRAGVVQLVFCISCLSLVT